MVKIKVNGPGRSKIQHKECILGSSQSMRGYILTCSGLQRENISQLWVLNRGDLSSVSVSGTPLLEVMKGIIIMI